MKIGQLAFFRLSSSAENPYGSQALRLPLPGATRARPPAAASRTSTARTSDRDRAGADRSARSRRHGIRRGARHRARRRDRRPASPTSSSRNGSRPASRWCPASRRSTAGRARSRPPRSTSFSSRRPPRRSRPSASGVRAEHPYDTPEVLALPVVAVDARYAAWVSASVLPRRAAGPRRARGHLTTRPAHHAHGSERANAPARRAGATAATALLDPEGGAGAELRGHVPDDPRGVVLILHGGAERSRMPVAWWRLPVLRMVPFASTIARRAGDDLAVLRLKYRVRGWNGSRQDPVHDARWALDRIRRTPARACPSSSWVTRWADASPCTSAPSPTSRASRPSHRGSRATPAGRGPARPCCSCTAPVTASPTRAAPTSSRDGSPTAGSTCATCGSRAATTPCCATPRLWHDTVGDFVTAVLLGRGRTS